MDRASAAGDLTGVVLMTMISDQRLAAKTTPPLDITQLKMKASNRLYQSSYQNSSQGGSQEQQSEDSENSRSYSPKNRSINLLTKNVHGNTALNTYRLISGSLNQLNTSLGFSVRA